MKGNSEAAQISRHRKELRYGFSTGTAAAAAAKAALYELLALPCPETVRVTLPGGGPLAVPLAEHRRLGSGGEAVVVKDAGDDPDVTHGARIGVRAKWANGRCCEALAITAGEGVGRVTKPGLPLAVGEPAVNPTPRAMLRRAVREVGDQLSPPRLLRVHLEIFVPQGEELARRTLNPRLGIVGGISILGTTGLVKPFSHSAYRATIIFSLKVAKAMGLKEVVFSTGGRSEAALVRLLPHLPEEAFVQMGDYLRFALKAAAHLGFSKILVGAYIGKALKMAQGFSQTHASRGMASFSDLALWLREKTKDSWLAQAVAQANTAREVLEIIPSAQIQPVMSEVGGRMLAALRSHAGPAVGLTAVILGFNDLPLYWQYDRGGSK